MFVLDTNILSEMMRRSSVPEAAAGIERQDEDLLFTTAISQAVVFAGLAVTAHGRRHDLEKAAHMMFEAFEGRVLSFDTGAGTVQAELVATRRQASRPAARLDLMIVSIARSHSASMVTCDVGDFEGCDLTLIYPRAAP